MDDPRLLRIDVHAQLLQDSTRRPQRDTRLRRGRAGDDPVVRVPRELITLASHLPIKRRQENVAQQRRGYPALRRPSFSREEPTLSVATRCPHGLNEAQDSAIDKTLGNNGGGFLSFPEP